METISLKMDEAFLKEIDKNIKQHRYSTRTEFIRDAIREKLEELDKEDSLKRLKEYFGASKRKTTNGELERVREKAGEEFLKRWKERKLK